MNSHKLNLKAYWRRKFYILLLLGVLRQRAVKCSSSYLGVPFHSLPSSAENVVRRQENPSQGGCASGAVQNQWGRDVIHRAQAGVPQGSAERETDASSCQGQSSTYGNAQKLHRAINTRCSLAWNALEAQCFRRSMSCFYFACWITWEEFWEHDDLDPDFSVWDSTSGICLPARAQLWSSA